MKPRIVLGVTSDVSLRLLEGAPLDLQRRGWEVHVVSSPGPLLDRLRDADIAVHPVPLDRDPSWRDLGGLIRWWLLLRRLRPDLVVTGTPKAGLVGMISARAAGVRARIYVLRGLRLESTIGLKRRVLLAAERAAARAAHRVLAVSPSLARRAIELGVAPADKIIVLGDGSSNGVDVARFRNAPLSLRDLRAELGFADDVPIVGYVGRLTRDKGVDVLAQARDILIGSGRKHAVLVVGGEDGASATVELRDHDGYPVARTGRVDDVERYYPLMSVLVLPTNREGFPNVVLEAAATGVPAIVTDATGAVDSVVDGETGRIVPVQNPQSLAAALENVFANPETWAQMGERARRRAEERFDRATVWDLQDGFYRDLLASRSQE